ncbi:chemerin-like receptor 1 [Hyperolius riggenbachi]|uniref:chemerin-like receptor 1 n=1 Tax=Hyperolius riggenbachi TaxID=752182 RepID=UPI0035A29386
MAYLNPNITLDGNTINFSMPGTYEDYVDDDPQNSSSYSDDYNLQLDKALIFAMVFYSLTSLLGVTGNGLVIYFTTFRMKRSVTVVWFINLAIADFIFAFFQPLTIVYYALYYGWPFGRFMCKLHREIFFMNLYVSVFLLTVISIDRCISVTCPVWSRNNRTLKLAYIVAAIVWILAFIFCLPYIIIGDTDFFDGNIICIFGTISDWDNAMFWQISLVISKFIASFLIPFTIIVSCYTILLFSIRRRQITTTSKPLKITVAVISSFFICWFPYHVLCFLEVFHMEKYDPLHKVVVIAAPLISSLASVNSCVNPVLYVFMAQDFKKTFSSSFQAIFERAFTEESPQPDSGCQTPAITSEL